MRLLKHFGSIERIAKAPVEELAEVVGSHAAQNVMEHYERQREIGKAGADKTPSS